MTIILIAPIWLLLWASLFLLSHPPLEVLTVMTAVFWPIIRPMVEIGRSTIWFERLVTLGLCMSASLAIFMLFMYGR